MVSHLSVAAEPRFMPGASVQSRVLGFSLRHGVRPLVSAWSLLPFDFIPPNLVDHLARLLPVHEGTRWRTIHLPDCSAEWLRAKGVDESTDNGTILYFHGGAFLTCGINTHRRLVSRISFASKQPVLNVDYRQMPREPVASSVRDGVSAFEWLITQGYRPDQITIAGDSAGGYLAFCVARAVMDAGHGKPAGVVAISPLLEFDPTRKQSHPNANRCQAFPLRAFTRLSEVTQSFDTRRGVAGRRVCPVDMPLADMPPALIHIGSREVLMADAELMANRLTSAGVPCDLQVWDRQVHVFQAAASWVPEARAAIEEIGTFVRHLASAQSVDVTAPAGSVRDVAPTPTLEAVSS